MDNLFALEDVFTDVLMAKNLNDSIILYNRYASFYNDGGVMFSSLDRLFREYPHAKISEADSLEDIDDDTFYIYDPESNTFSVNNPDLFGFCFPEIAERIANDRQTLGDPDLAQALARYDLQFMEV